MTRQHERRDFVLGSAEWLLDVGAAFQQRLDDAQMAADDGNVDRRVGKSIAAIDARDAEAGDGLILGHGEIILDKSIEKEILLLELTSRGGRTKGKLIKQDR